MPVRSCLKNGGAKRRCPQCQAEIVYLRNQDCRGIVSFRLLCKVYCAANQRRVHLCVDCLKPIERHGEHCVECYKKAKREHTRLFQEFRNAPAIKYPMRSELPTIAIPNDFPIPVRLVKKEEDNENS